MILCDREIKAALEHGLIGIDPEPHAEAFDSTTVDLTLASDYEVWEPFRQGERVVIEPGRSGFRFSELADLHPSRVIDPERGLIVPPRMFFLAWTREKITLPVTSRIAARVEGKSSLARLGLGVHLTAPTIQAGFSGRLQLEVTNVGDLTIRLVPGMSICQLIFEVVFGTPEQGYQGTFLNQ
jgi:dCTP deaminase